MRFGVIHDFLGHYVILMSCDPRLLSPQIGKQPPFALFLKILFAPAPTCLSGGRVKAEMKNFPVRWIGQCGNRSHRVAVYANHARGLRFWYRCSLVGKRQIPFAIPVKEFARKVYAALVVAHGRPVGGERNGFSLEYCRDTKRGAVPLDLPPFVTTNWQHNVGYRPELLIALVFGDKALGYNAGSSG